MTKSPLLEVEQLSVRLAAGGSLRPLTPVDGLSFSLSAGETLALVGESGCGKSMTALALMRLLPEGAWAEGAVRLDGVPLLDLPELEMQAIRGRRIAQIFQEPSTSLNPVLTVGEQIAEVLRQHFRMPRREALAESIRWLGRVGIPEPARRAGAYPFELSGGQKQRCMIAMALAARPAIVLADEPTTALDVTLQKQILELLRQLQAETGMALLLITHDLAVVRQMADRVALMYAGQIVEEAGAEAFFRSPLHPYARQLLAAIPSAGRKGRRLASIPGSVPPPGTRFDGCRFAPRCLAAAPGCRERAPILQRLPGGRRCACLRPGSMPSVPSANTPSTPACRALHRETVLCVERCSVAYPMASGIFSRKRFLALENATLSVAAGETLALVGESGSGKTTLGKAVLQLLRGRARISGRIEICGISALEARGEALLRLRQRAQMIFQDPFSSLDPRMTVEETLAEPLAALRRELGPGERAKRIRHALDQAGLPQDALRRYPHEFSGGQRQRIAIARALAPDPRLIVCDEPTSALDVSVQAQILNLLADIQRESGLAYLLITHNFGVVEHLADQVCVIRAGRIVESGPAQSVLRSPREDYTRQLLASAPSLQARPLA